MCDYYYFLVKTYFECTTVHKAVNTMGVTRELNVQFYERKTLAIGISYFYVRGYTIRSGCAAYGARVLRKMLTILVRLLCQY